MFPMPPRMIMITTRIEVENLKKSDVVAPWYAACNAPATPANAAPRRERQELRADGVDAHHLGRHLVLADRHPGAAHARALQVARDDDADDEQEEAEIDRRRSR